jgi:hypothetical protein
MKQYLILFAVIALLSGCASTKTPTATTAVKEVKSTPYTGFFNFEWNEKTGKILLEIPEFDQEFLYVNYLAAGIGSNDIGLDRGQIGDNRVVKFVRSGPKVLLMQPNYNFRAISDNENEIRSVQEAFASSVIWGFKIANEKGGKIKIDITEFLLSDSHGVSQVLKKGKQGSYSLDTSRSAVYLDQTKNFKDNTEFEATLTFKGQATSAYIRSVVPTPSSVTVRTHHSFVRLPELEDYTMRKYDPRSGFYAMEYQDYATPIEESLVKRFIYRHKLEKKNPELAISEPVKPIIYYVDKGAPEPVRSALIEGSSWWNQAFEAAGYKNAFQVYVLPDSADALDINYNVIQWVHRSTRGWSYGSWIGDPRTGQILKGHVSLGSLRIRQDFLIATGLIMPYEDGEEVPEDMKEMALARLRQLSAHEVGHTLGLYHNFAASTNGRASVMDYPHPLIKLNENGEIDLSDAYDQKIGDWDKYAIRYGYSDFEKEDKTTLNSIINEWVDEGLDFMMDNDARSVGSANPKAHLWDNGKNPADELTRITAIRSKVLSDFSENAIRTGEPIANMEEVIIPMYFLHRFQIEGAAKLIGGVDYTYKTKGDALAYPKVVDGKTQKEALTALTNTLQPEFLAFPEEALAKFSVKPPGFGRGRESFNPRTGDIFDPIAAAETAADMTLKMIFNEPRLERANQQHLVDQEISGANEILSSVINATWKSSLQKGLSTEIKIVVEKRVLYHLFNLIASDIAESVKATAYYQLTQLEGWLKYAKTSNTMLKAHYVHSLFLIEQFKKNPSKFEIPDAVTPPDGSPIGMEMMCGFE